MRLKHAMQTQRRRTFDVVSIIVLSSTDGATTSNIALSVEYLILNAQYSCSIPLSNETKWVGLANSRGTYSTAAN